MVTGIIVIVGAFVAHVVVVRTSFTSAEEVIENAGAPSDSALLDSIFMMPAGAICQHPCFFGVVPGLTRFSEPDCIGKDSALCGNPLSTWGDIPGHIT